ncbi:Cu(I)/Ag(I) efflux system membrane fusion protein [Flavobacterium sp. 28A]|uniref:efflux RND transporter periplasmic adaptor subunit n=1 Tax=Flavobacterium sp. 28A TaxID=2735895 RepID=UPI0015702909|nr:efflux RND transporter periplasmic adaptor subunit [Flavobacterium sp. 28A]NRT13949.1 Cu(I)/Ag(I) efflux system membrane fusion protein [Flavobacterium sp. 28A]
MKELHKICFLIIGFIFVLGCNSKNEDKHETHEFKESIYYTCSMDPQIKEDKPGKCPICHMELTPMKKDNGAYNSISLSDQQIKLGNISTALIGTSQQSQQGNYTGVLTVNPEAIKSISARAVGRIEKLYFKTEGDFIQKGQAVYQLYSEPIAIAKQDYVSAYSQLAMPGDFGKNAKTMVAAAKQKLLFYGLSNTQIEAVKKSKEVSPYTTFYSSYSGTISEITATEGSYVMEGAPIIKVANLSTLWLETQVNVNYAKSLRLGQTATISFVDFPSKSVQATISFINPEINPDTRLLLIQLEVANPGLLLKPGMQANVQVTQSNQKGIFVPIDAVVRDEKVTFIWVEKSHGVFENLKVTTGLESNGMIEITSTIDTNKKIVITGVYAVNSEYEFRKGKDPMAGMKM